MAKKRQQEGPRLTSLTMRGIKGSVGDAVRLAPVTFIHGPNASGKSRIKDAISLAVLGYLPGLPKTVDGVLRLASGDEIDVEATFDVGAQQPVTVARTWRRFEVEGGADAGKLKGEATVYVSTCTSDGKKANEAAAAAFFGDPVLFDLAGLLDLSDVQRRKMLFRLGGEHARAAWTPERVRSALPDHIADVADGWDPDEDDLLEWCASTFERARAELLAVRRRIEAERAAERSVREHLEAPDPAVVGAVERRLEAAEKAARDDARQRGEGVEALRGRLRAAEALADEIASARQEAERLRRELDGLRQGAGGDQAAPLVARLRQLEQGGGWGPARVVGLVDLERVADDARRQLDEPAETAARDAAVNAAEGLARLVDDADGALRAARDVVAERLSDHRAASRAAEELNAVLARLSPSGWGAQKCPTCQQPVARAHIAALLVRGAELAGLAKRAAEAWESAKRAVVDAERVHGDLVARHRQEMQVVDRADADLRGERTRREQSLHEAERALRARRQEVEDVRRALVAAEGETPDTARVATLEERLRVVEARAERRAPDVDALRAELADARGRADDTERQADARLGEIKAELIELRKVLRDLEQAETHKERRLQLEQEEAVAKAWAAAFGPHGLMGGIVADVLAPFCDAVNAAIGDLDLGTFAVRLADEREHAVFHLGLQRGETFAPVETLSGGESAAVHAGISVGLATLVGAHWSVAIIDNVERLDSKRRRAFMVRMVALQAAGQVHQVLMFGCPDQVDAVKGVVAIEAGG